MSRDRLRLLAAIGVQLLILAMVPAPQVLAGWRGQLVTLATRPYDPFDPFSGAYVRLAYDVEQPGKGMALPELSDGDTLYVVVEQSQPAWRLVGYVTELPAPRPGRAALKATWHRNWPRLDNAGKLYLPSERAQAAEAALASQRDAWWKAVEQVRAEAKDRSGPAVEPPQPSAEVDLRVDDSGAVRLIALRVDGKVFAD